MVLLAYEIITLEELLRRLEKYNHKELHVHHTWRPNHDIYKDKPDGIYWQKAMRDFHVNNNGWSDIGQHVTLLPDGKFVTGRSFTKTPASIKGYNTGAFAVEMIGDFDIGHDKFEGKQKASMIGLARWFNQKGKYVRFHREDKSSGKSCPGTGIDKNDFMREVKGTMALVRGDKGDAVKKLQEDLLALGYDFEGYGADGSFGGATERTVIQFQKDHGLKVDGKAGAETQGKIAELLKQKVENAEVNELKNKIAKLETDLKTANNKLLAIENTLKAVETKNAKYQEYFSLLDDIKKLKNKLGELEIDINGFA